MLGDGCSPGNNGRRLRLRADLSMLARCVCVDCHRRWLRNLRRARAITVYIRSLEHILRFRSVLLAGERPEAVLLAYFN